MDGEEMMVHGTIMQPMTVDHLQELYDEMMTHGIEPYEGGFYSMHFVDENNVNKKLTFKIEVDDLFGEKK